MTKSDAYDILTERFNYPEEVAKDMCDYFSSSELTDYIEFLEGER